MRISRLSTTRYCMLINLSFLSVSTSHSFSLIFRCASIIIHLLPQQKITWVTYKFIFRSSIYSKFWHDCHKFSWPHRLPPRTLKSVYSPNLNETIVIKVLTCRLVDIEQNHTRSRDKSYFESSTFCRSLQFKFSVYANNLIISLCVESSSPKKARSRSMPAVILNSIIMSSSLLLLLYGDILLAKADECDQQRK